MYWINEWSHSVAVVDAATDTEVALIPLGAPPIQPVDMVFNSIEGVVYTANRLTLNVGVISPEPSGCLADLDGSGAVDAGDLGILLSGWGTPSGDLDGDKQTTSSDLGVLLAAWGPC
jgi:hypothetical protein